MTDDFVAPFGGCIWLSAGIPEHPVENADSRVLATAVRARTAISSLAMSAFDRDLQIVTHADFLIMPTLLHIALGYRRLVGNHPRVLAIASRRDAAVKALAARWDAAGDIIAVDADIDGDGARRVRLDIGRLRNPRGAFFIGGGETVEHDGKDYFYEKVPCFAFPTTGPEAAYLYRQGDKMSGDDPRVAQTLATQVSLPLAIDACFTAMGF